MGKLKKDWDDLDSGEKGDWYFMNHNSYIVLRFGDTMEDIVVLPLEGEKAWAWNKNIETPTLTPSILVHGKENEPDKWHGYLTDGKLITV